MTTNVISFTCETQANKQTLTLCYWPFFTQTQISSSSSR